MAINYTPEEITEILNDYFSGITHKQYIGARYVPIFGRKDEDSIEWDNTGTYEPLTIVLYQGNSFTSRQYVPIGVDITNQAYWANTGNYNAQIEQYRREVAELGEYVEGEISDIKDDISEIDELLIAHIMMRNQLTNDWKPKLCISRNGLDWNPVPGTFDTNTAYGEMSRPYFKDGKAYFVCRTSGTNNKTGYYVTEDFVNATFKTVDLGFPEVSVSTHWTPQIVEDAAGNTYLIATIFTGEQVNTLELNPTIGQAIYASSDSYPLYDESVCYIVKVDIDDGEITGLEQPSKININFGNVTDYCGIDYDILYWNGIYHLLYRDTRFYTIAHATASSIYGPYTIADYDNLAVFKDVQLEAPVMTVINNRVYVNFQTFSRAYGANMLVSTVDFQKWDFIGYPRRIDHNQFNVPNASSHGERPRNISPQVLPDSMKTSLIRSTFLVETGGYHENDFETTLFNKYCIPYYNAYYTLSGKRMCPCLPNPMYDFESTGFSTNYFRENTVAIYADFNLDMHGFYPFSSYSMRINNSNKMHFWRINNSSQYFAGGNTQTITLHPQYAQPVIGGSTAPVSIELPCLISPAPVRAFVNITPTGTQVELKLIKVSSYSGNAVPANTQLFRLPFKITGTTSIPYITRPTLGELYFSALDTNYIVNDVELNSSNINGNWVCSKVLTQWQYRANNDPN